MPPTSILPHKGGRKIENKNIQRNLLKWYRKNKRDLPWRRTTDPYAIWVSEIMLQQTQVATVIPYYKNFLKSFPSVRNLARADLSRVLKVWEGLGYYSRARNLHRASQIVSNHYHGKSRISWKIFAPFPELAGTPQEPSSLLPSIKKHLFWMEMWRGCSPGSSP